MQNDERRAILISGITQYAYCPRRFMLIHLEGEFEENIYTLQGRQLHERADEPLATYQDGVTMERAMPLWSDKLGLQGKADTVEFHEDGTVKPVEYKRGSRRPQRPGDLQLCAQALCLEEMLGVTVAEGSIFYHESRRCRRVAFDDGMRDDTLRVIGKIREMMEGEIPPPPNDRRCPKCSLLGICRPELVCSAAEAKAATRLFRPTEEVKT